MLRLRVATHGRALWKGLLTPEPESASGTALTSNILLTLPKIAFMFIILYAFISGAHNIALSHHSTAVMEFSLNTNRMFFPLPSLTFPLHFAFSHHCLRTFFCTLLEGQPSESNPKWSFVEECGTKRHKNSFVSGYAFFSTTVRTLKVVRIRISLEKFSCMVEQVRRCQLVVAKSRIFSSSKNLFKANMYIWYLQVLNVQILTQEMEEPRLNKLCFFLKGWAYYDSD